MTGFGSCTKNIKDIGQVTIELRSINHRALELLFHLPEEWHFLEEPFRQVLVQRLRRGRISCALKVNNPANKSNIFDEGQLAAYARKLKQIQRRLRLSGEVTLETLLSLPGVLRTAPAYKNISHPGFKATLEAALEKLLQQRSKEGRSLLRDFKRRSYLLKGFVEKIAQRFKLVVAKKAKVFLSPEDQANYLRSIDITEEIVRLKFHLQNFLRNLAKRLASGKELDFIAQELMREANTIGAKSVDTVVSNYVVKIKSEIEKIREQLQNVE